MTALALTVEGPVAKALGALGALLVAGAASLELVQIAAPYGFPFWGWVAATIVGLGLLWSGLNTVRQDLGARVVAACSSVALLIRPSSCVRARPR